MSNSLTLSMAADSGAVSQYDGITFTGFFSLAGVVYGCAPDGLYRLGADDDAGEPILAIIEGPRLDAGTDMVKRVRGGSIQGGNIDGLTLFARCDGGDWMPGTPLGQGQFVFGRGSMGTDVQWRVESDGQDFEVTSVSLDLLNLGRRRRRV